MTKNLALWVSIIFQPLLMPTILFAILFNFAPMATNPIKGEEAFYLLLAIVITTFILPVLGIVGLRYSTTSSSSSIGITGLNMETRQERVLPFLFTTIFYALATFLFIYRFKLHGVFIIILATITLLISLVALINVYFKISAHSAGIWGVTGFLYAIALKFEAYQLLTPLIIVIIIAGLVMASRLYLNVHKSSEVWLGALLGFVLCTSSTLIFLP